MNDLLVSVLLSYYKGEEYLETYLTNVSQQTFARYIQLVFVGCLLSDSEKAIIKKFEDKIRIKKVFLDELKPQSECWNIAIKESDADICCIWNIDDLRTDSSVENQFNKLSLDETTDVTFGLFVISKKLGDGFGQLIDHSKYDAQEYHRSFLLGPFFMFRKSVCNSVGYFDEQLKSGADYDFAVRLAKKHKIEMIQTIDGYFLDAQKGLSTRGDNRQPIERTVVELRYNILDKVDAKYVPLTKEYKINEIRTFGNWTPVTSI